MLMTLFCCVFCVPAVFTLAQEPTCLSRYDYDYKIMKTMVEMEQDMKNLRREMDAQKELIEKQVQEIQEMSASVTDTGRQLEQKLNGISRGTGSTYVRWGRTTCPGNGTEMVYSGYASGSHHTHTGAAANYLCLPSDPLWGEYDDTLNKHNLVYGAEYEIFGSYSSKFFGKSIGDHDVPCAVCRTERANVLFLPGRNACYDGWTLEYSGYLVGGHPSHPAASEYVCLDAEPEMIPDSATGTTLKGDLALSNDMTYALQNSHRENPYENVNVAVDADNADLVAEQSKKLHAESRDAVIDGASDVYPVENNSYYN